MVLKNHHSNELLYQRLQYFGGPLPVVSAIQWPKYENSIVWIRLSILKLKSILKNFRFLLACKCYFGQFQKTYMWLFVKGLFRFRSLYFFSLISISRPSWSSLNSKVMVIVKWNFPSELLWKGKKIIASFKAQLGWYLNPFFFSRFRSRCFISSLVRLNLVRVITCYKRHVEVVIF